MATTFRPARCRVMATPYYDGPPSDHFDGVRFFNRYGPTVDRGLRDIRRWRSHSRSVPWQSPVASVAADQPPAQSESLRITVIGHASLLIQTAGRNILLDPVWSNRASPLRFAGPRRHQPPGVAFDALPAIDTVLITHSHYDHLDIPTLRRLWRRDRPRLIAPLGNDIVLRRAAEELRVETGDWWQRLEVSPRVAVSFCPAIHWSARSPWDRRRALWCGYVLHTPAGAVYLAGDTAYGSGQLFSEIRRRHGRPLLAVLPIGAYEPRWFMQSQHMNPEEAVRALRGCGAQAGIGVHWGTFKLTDEPQDAPLAALAAARAAHGIAPSRFWAGSPGQVWRPPLTQA